MSPCPFHWQGFIGESLNDKQSKQMSTRKLNLFLLFTAMLIAASYMVTDVAGNLVGPFSDLFSRLSGAEGYSLVAEMMAPQEQISFWSGRVNPNGGDYLNLTNLGQAYMLQARETGDAAAYARAEEALSQALAANPNYRPAQAYMSSVLISLHRFAEALALAQQAYAADPDELQALATMGDAQLELGDYAAAAATYEELHQRAPSAPVFGRLSRLAWIQGDVAGAIEWMEQAAEAAESSGTFGEQLAWYHFQLGELHFHRGDLRHARRSYQQAAAFFDNYYLAQAGLAKVTAAEGDIDAAITQYQALVARRPQPDYIAALGDLYTLQGDTAAAEEQYETVLFISQLEETQQILYNRAVALFLANHDRQLDKALADAQLELEARQDIYAHDTLAWALYKNGRYEEAADAMQQALSQGTQDALLFYHHGMIEAALGRTENAQATLQQALMLNPHFDLLQAQQARATLAVIK